MSDTSRRIKILIVGDDSGYDETLRKMPGKARRAARKAGDEQVKEHTKTSKHLSRQVGRDLRTIGTGLGSLSGAAGRTTRTLGALTTGIAASATAAGPLTLGIAGVGAAAAVAVAAVGGLVVGIVQLSRKGREVYKELQAFRDLDDFVPKIKDDTLDSFDRINASFSSINTIAKATGLTLAADLAPTIEGVTVGVVAAGLAVGDFTEGLFGLIGGVNQAFDAMHPLAKILTVVATGGTALVFTIDDMAESFRTGATEQGSYTDRARALITTQTEVNKRLGKGRDTLKELNELWKGNSKVIDLIYAQNDALTEEQRIHQETAELFADLEEIKASAFLKDQARANIIARRDQQLIEASLAREQRGADIISGLREDAATRRQQAELRYWEARVAISEADISATDREIAAQENAARRQRELRQIALEEETTAHQIIADLRADTLTERQQVEEAYLARVQTVLEAEISAEDRRLALAEATARRERELIEMRRGELRQLADTALQTGDLLLSSVSTSMEAIDQLTEGASKKSMAALAKRQAAFQKAGIIMDAARAAMAALTPPPVGLGPLAGKALVPVIAGTAALQIAAVSQAARQVRHSGGRTAPDEVDLRTPAGASVRAKNDEVVISSLGAGPLADALLAANRGEGGGSGGSGRIVFQLDHRYFGEFMERDLGLTQSPLRRAIGADAGIGHYNNRKRS